ncbi:hypothetical protein G6F46_004143 [Rhizopus delemar]|uniref:F-box domain-containing protein n=2 Tax=Rhizopus TaxID=4842 RepID=A0A9P6Z6X1_9FUNG|nr:hypothetical protein G6F43_010369 [Rhizopus delemar]KAG1546828.1 hypothetical protein G6F51_004643 [Rhizopus arrhizus]KAG1462153.1 hypothetical protein G6F55_003134 [Rhizopus delemar]KAG1500333.1 hypothetical protein G6F54_003792 [Rhizopus delemar]KAG1514012.1 hypothetical protein G6F53_003993 [Rhizopus delemar]
MNEQENELERFRNEWRQEVKEKHHIQDTKHKDKEPATEKRLSTAESSLSDMIDKAESLTLEKAPITAMDHYVLAVDNERQGKIGKALDSYRRAFKLDPDIVHAYKRHYQTAILPKLHESLPSAKEEEKFKHIVPICNEYVPPTATLPKDVLSPLIEEFSQQDTSYIPRLDYKTVAIAKLPGEIMLYLLRYLALHSLSTIPQFALTCKRFFLYTREPSIWQYASVHIFRLPSMTLEESKDYQVSKVMQQYNGQWLRMYIDRPRIRYDGVYISTCHYIRQGTSETAWNQPIHFVTYYRYLRFFPNGTVLKHVTTDEPAHVVKALQPGFHRQQVFLGQFLFEEDDESVIIEMKDPMLPKETFHMSLKLKTTHRGKHNKLVWEEYTSVSSVPDRNHHVHDLKLLKPYFFSPRCIEASFVQKITRHHVCRRLFISFLILAALLTMIVPTWQVYTEEGRSSTLISYKEPNLRGESLYIAASVLNVDFLNKKYTINFLVQPNGTLANEYGQLNQQITLKFSSFENYHFEKGETINPIQVSFNYEDGNQIDYPFDIYFGNLDVSAFYVNDTAKSIPITFHLDASITSFHFMPSIKHQPVLEDDDDNEPFISDRISLKISTGRSTTTLVFSIFICILMWLLSLIMSLFAYQVVFRKRKADAHACMIGITTLFALPAVRSAQPGIPDVGTVSDILGFYWNMALIACSSIAVIMCWVIRWEDPVEENKRQMSISTCVEEP